jgi:hypothetical protein
MRILRPHKWLRFFLRGVHTVQLHDVDKLKKTKCKTYPVPLVIKQSSCCVQHLGIGFLLAHIGDKVGRVGMHLHRKSQQNLFTPPHQSSQFILTMVSLLFTSFLYLGAIGSMSIQRHATARGFDFERLKIDGCVGRPLRNLLGPQQ